MSGKIRSILFLLIILYSFGCNSTEPKISDDENVILVESLIIEEWVNDDVNIISASFINDILSLSVQYGGGCEEHFFKLIIPRGIEKSNPPQTTFFLSHDSNGDGCEALISEEIRFDLTEYKEYLLNAFNTSEIVVKFYESDVKLLYSF